jgi:hypothetical protein
MYISKKWLGDICKLKAVENLKLKKFVGKTHGGAVFFSTKGVNLYMYIYLYLDIYDCTIDVYWYLYICMNIHVENLKLKIVAEISFGPAACLSTKGVNV